MTTSWQKRGRWLAFLALGGFLLCLMAPVESAVADDRKDLEKDARRLKKSIRESPEKIDNYYKLTVVFTQLGNFEDAESYAKTYVSKKPDDPKGHFQMGVVLAGLERCEGALDHFDTAIAGDKSETRLIKQNALAEKGDCLSELGKNAEAIEAYRQAMTEGAEDSDLLLGIGAAYAGMGNIEEAKKTFNQVTELDPDNPIVRYNLGMMLRRQAKKTYDSALYKEAAQSFEKAAALRSGYAKAHFFAAETYLFANDAASAKPHLEKYLELEPEGSNSAAAKEYLKMVQ